MLTNFNQFIITHFKQMVDDGKKQQEMKEEIRMYLRKKDYYDILGISKTANDADIKKAYKKLALRFHPDKNSIEGSKEVFKKVSNAYTNLIDPQKKAMYDRYGPEEDRQAQYRPQRQYRQGYQQQDEFEEIFRAFFGQTMPRRGFQNGHFQHYTFNMGGNRGQWQQAHPNNNQQQQGGSHMIYFLILILVVYILPVFFSKQQPLFSTSQSSTYKYQIKTSVLQVPYFVRQEYFSEKKDNQFKIQIEKEVDREYYIRLGKDCEIEKWARNQAYYYGRQKINRDSCAKFNLLQQKHMEYLRDLVYAY